jgi:hypothetical protein
MMATRPQTAFAVRLDANRHMEQRCLGYREIQVRSFVRLKLESGAPFPSLGELKRELGFYDKAGAYRVLKRLGDKGAI